ncbi:hypothetical protein PMAYCL1PPCAC_09023, partial [Pristionchus mayeri]
MKPPAVAHPTNPQPNPSDNPICTSDIIIYYKHTRNGWTGFDQERKPNTGRSVYCALGEWIHLNEETDAAYNEMSINAITCLA